MNLEKKEVITVKDSAGIDMKVGAFYIFQTNARLSCGIYAGIVDKKYMKFVGVDQLKDVEFNVLPKSIEAIYPMV